MKTALLIPIHKQSEYFLDIYNGIESQTESPDSVYLLLDRPTKEEYKHISDICKSKTSSTKYNIMVMNDVPEYVGKPTNIPGESLFLTGYRRNTGIDKAIEDGHEIFVFIDGDCIPEKNLIASHKKSCSVNLPILACGRRKESRFDWKDQRDSDPDLKPINLFKDGGTIIYNVEFLKRSAIVWTCNVSLNLRAVKLLKKLNKKYYGRDELFNSEFLGSWGGEDSFLGLQTVFCKIMVASISGADSGIRHIDHPRPNKKYSYDVFQKTLETQVELLEYMFKKDPIDLEFFVD